MAAAMVDTAAATGGRDTGLLRLLRNTEHQRDAGKVGEGRKVTKSNGLIAAAAIASTMICGAATAQQAQPASLTDASLAGKWVVNLGKCSDGNAEFITFGGNGAVESMRDGLPSASGDWTTTGSC